MSWQPYLASQDSALLREALRAHGGVCCLEIGAGNGGNLVDLATRFEFVVGTDLVRPGMTDWKGGRINYILADGASCLRDDSFELVAINPPYLKDGGSGDGAVEGGEKLEVPRAFLREALRTVKKSGRILILVNDSADVRDLEREGARASFSFRRVATRRLFFEELAVYEASQNVRLQGRQVDSNQAVMGQSR